MKQRRAILVLGMHRSGTSVLSRVLSLRGAELPANLLSANRGNETGYWEPAPIVELNDQLLGYFGVDWDDPFAALQIPGADAFPERFHTRAQKLLEQEYGNSDLFVLKDPRITLLHDFWFAVLARMNVKICPVVVMRPYTEVAESLLKRDQTTAESSVMLYVAYGVEVAAALEKRDATFLTYEQLVFDWRGATDRVAAQHGFKWAKSSAYTDMEVADFLVERPAKARKIHLSNTLECWASMTWDWFRACAEGESQDVAPLMDIRAQLTEAAKTYSPLLAERRRRYRIVQAAQIEAESTVKEGYRALIESQTQLETMAQERDAFHSERDRVLALYETTNAELSKTQGSYRTLDEDSGRLKAQLGEKEKAQGELQRQLEKFESKFEALSGQRDGMQSERDKLLALYEGTHAELEVTQGSYRALEDENARLKAALGMQDKAQNELTRQLEKLESKHEALAGLRNGLQSERDKLLALYETTHAELGKTQGSYRTLEDESARLKTQLGMQDKAQNELQRQLEKLESKHETLAGVRDGLQAERDRLLASQQRTDAELTTTKAAYQALNVQHGQAQATLQELLSTRDELQAERARLLENNQRMDTELATTKSAYQALNAQHGQAQATLQELLSTRDELQAERARLLENNQRTDSELTTTKSAYQALNAQHGQAQTTLQELLSTRDELRIERDRLLENNQRTDSELTTTKSAYEELNVQHEQAQATLQELLSMRDALQAERDRLLENNQRTDSELTTTKSAYEELNVQHGQARTTLQELLSARNALQTERDGLLQLHQSTDAELTSTKSAFQHISQEHDQLEHDRASIAAQLQQAQVQLLALSDERNGLFDERNSLLELYRQTDAALTASNAAFTSRSEELESVRSHGDRAVSDLAYTRAALEMAMKRSEALRDERDIGAQELELTRITLAKGQQDLEQLKTRLDQLTQQASAEARRSEELIGQLKRALNELHLSSSWRMTAPLRSIAIGGRKLKESAHLIWPLKMKPLLRLPAPIANQAGPLGARESVVSAAVKLRPAPENPAPITDRSTETETPQPAHVPAFTSREHNSLRHFLNEEFDPLSADDVILRIDRYRLPVDGDAIRTAARASCSESDVAGWVDGITRLAAARPQLGDAVDVSIVIPVYNQIQFTLACIESLLAHDTRFSFEILIGDDASSDTTEFALSKPIPGVRHVRHSSNLGFVRNCNATATLARGRYVVMLNNDTQVLPNWLDELIGVLENDARIGLAGSKLIYPDGRLQECGGIVWRDGSAWNFGRLDDPRRPEYSYLRDADYVSGASIALSTELWRQLGGFDELFVPAYAEDADMAFRVRALGLRTVVQPLSQILHFEGVSSGTDVTQGAKAYQVENLKKLYQRWQGALTSHRANADRPDLEKERAVKRRMLFIDLCTPTPNEDAGSLVAVEIMHAFRDNGFKVTFIPEDNFAHMGATTRDLQRVGIETIYHPSYSSIPAFLSARHDPFDVIFLLRFRVGEAHMQKLCEKYPSAKVIFSNCDLHFLREMREAELSGDSAAMALAYDTQRRELDVIRAADVNLVHSEIEMDILHKEAPEAVCTLFPLVHDPVSRIPPLQERDGLCFVGGYRHAPNADGIIWFVENVWPLVRQHVPTQKLYIAGSSMTADVKALAKHTNVEIVGFVDDLEAFLAKRRATIAPLRFGAGAKGKIAVSLANGVPVVSTTIGSEGMQLTAGMNVLVANSEQALASFAIEILSNDRLWHELSAAGLQYAAEVTSRASARARVRSIIAELGL